MPKDPCPYCGNNPVPHFLYWYNETLNILLTPLRQKLLYNPFSRWLKKNNFSALGSGVLFNMGRLFRIITLQPDITKCKVRRAQVLWEEADRRGIKFFELLLFGRPFDSYLAIKNNRKILFSGLPRPSRQINSILDLMDDKWLLKKMLAAKNLPVAEGASCKNFSEALRIFRQVQKPVIVKPRTGSRGRHSTTFIHDERKLYEAFKIAKQLCYWVVVEDQLFGPVYRATVINFELKGVLRGDPPQVTGDGKLTIENLVKEKNSQQHPGVNDIKIDPQSSQFLASQGFGWSTILPPGQTINLSEKIGVSYGGSSAEEKDICHPDNKELFTQAAKVLNDPIVGFDFIIPDITKSFKDQKCGFIEANSLPFINLHHDPLKGQPQNVASAVWDMVGF